MEFLVGLLIFSFGMWVGVSLQEMRDFSQTKEEKVYKIKYNPIDDKYEVYYGSKLIKQFMQHDEALTKIDYYESKGGNLEITK